MRGHVRQRGKSWQAIVVVSRDGQQHQLSATRPTRREAEDALVTLLARAGRAGSGGATTTMAELFAQWQALNAPTWSPSTVRNTRAVVERYLRPRWGAARVGRIRTADIDVWLAELHHHGGADGGPLSAATVRRIHTVLRSALTQAQRWQWVADNPAAHATLPRGERSTVTPPSPTDVVRLIDAARDGDPDFGCWLHLAAMTGARRGELCALQWADVDLDAGSVSITKALALGPGRAPVLKTTKTGNRRSVALHAMTVDELRAHRRRAVERALACGAALASDAWVFSLDVGATPWRPDLPSHRFARLRTTLGVGTRLHDLRHFHATGLLAAGVDLSTVAGRLGHAGGGRTTLAVYGHLLEEADRTAADIVGRLLKMG